MSHRRFIRSIALPLLACMAVAVVWVRSYRVMDEWSMASDSGETRALVVYQGAVHWVRGGTRAATRPIAYDAHEIPVGATWDDLYGSMSVHWRFLGFWKLELMARGTGMTPFRASGIGVLSPVPAPTTRRTQLAPWVFVTMQTARVFPLWPALAVALMPPAWLGWQQWWQSRRRRRAGLCPRCGYDLRATTARCPECGWEAPPPTQKSKLA